MPHPSFEDCTTPDLFASGTYRLDAQAPAPLRFRPDTAELRTHGALRHVAIGLEEEDRERRLLILTLWTCSPLLTIRPGRYRVTPSRLPTSAPIQVTAYLTRGSEWRCDDASRASDGRVMITRISRKLAKGAFQVEFPTLRAHGTFTANRLAAQFQSQVALSK